MGPTKRTSTAGSSARPASSASAPSRSIWTATSVSSFARLHEVREGLGRVAVRPDAAQAAAAERGELERLDRGARHGDALDARQQGPRRARVEVAADLVGERGGRPHERSDPGAVAGEDRRRDRLDREEAVLDVDQDEVEARERGELDDARDGPGEEAAEESLTRARSRA